MYFTRYKLKSIEFGFVKSAAITAHFKDVTPQWKFVVIAELLGISKQVLNGLLQAAVPTFTCTEGHTASNRR
jgi:predicted ABC-type sugar transport system permease subunit